MEQILILNASPRAPKSNSKRYAHLFSQHNPANSTYVELTKTNHLEIIKKIEGADQVLLVFPLYADAIPVTLLHFFHSLEKQPPGHRPRIHVLINCGFLEYAQNDIAVEMVRLFCTQNGYPFGSVLKIGSGEAILDSPFRFLAELKIKQLAKSIFQGKYQTFHVTMPLPKKLFLAASTQYWTEYGKKFGVSKEQMQTMEIEGVPPPQAEI